MGACRREEAIRNLLLRHPDRLKWQAVEEVASALGLSRATLYRLIARYRAARTVEALIEKPLGRPKDGRTISVPLARFPRLLNETPEQRMH